MPEGFNPRGSTKIALSRSGRRVIYADGTFSLGYLTFPLLAGKLDIFSIGEGVSCPCVPPRHALCVKTQGHRDAQGHPGTPRDAQGRSLGNAFEMAKK